MVDLTTNFAGIELASPVLLASGTCGYGRELEPFLDLDAIGGIVTKTITPEPRSGNEPPRIVETPAGMLNAIGLQNPGLEGFIRDKWPYLAELNTVVVVNIAAPTAELHGEMEEIHWWTALVSNSIPTTFGGYAFFFECKPIMLRLS